MICRHPKCDELASPASGSKHLCMSHWRVFAAEVRQIVDPSGRDPHKPCICHAATWDQLTPFQQGYIEALFAALHGGMSRMEVAVWRDPSRHPERLGKLPGFSDLAPETLAQIIEDCARRLAERSRLGSAKDGQDFYNARQRGTWEATYPPLTVTLGDDGKVYAAPAQGSYQ